MSTAALTISVAVAVLFGTAVSAVRLLWGRKAIEAALLAGGFFGILHLLVLWVAGDAALSATISQERWPGIADLSTWVYDITAWIALAFLAIGVILSVLQWRRERVMKKQLEQFFKCLFEPDEAEEN
jgi:hypothetical protein